MSRQYVTATPLLATSFEENAKELQLKGSFSPHAAAEHAVEHTVFNRKCLYHTNTGCLSFSIAVAFIM